MMSWILIVALLTPWFWGLPNFSNLFSSNINKDIVQARSVVVWQRGKVANPSFVDKVFLNWPTEFISQRLSVVGENTDINNYFFSGHPRERVGVEEKQKFFFFQFILLLVGLFSPLLKKYWKFLLSYFLLALFMSSLFKWRTSDQTIFFSLPFIVVMAMGLKKMFHSPKKVLALFLTFSVLEVVSFCLVNFKR